MRPFHATISALKLDEFKEIYPLTIKSLHAPMLRTIIIYLSQAEWARQIVMRFPLARRTALRFVAGENLEDALNVVDDLNSQGYQVTLDLLGEHTANKSEANESTRQILQVIDSISSTDLRASISIKLTQIGLKLNEQLCANNLSKILELAKANSIFVRIDMEEAACVDATLRLANGSEIKRMDNLGLVIQSYLYRSEADTASLLEEGFTIRLVKGAYKETSELAYPKKTDVDASFDRLTSQLLKASPATKRNFNWPPVAAIASHDENRVEFATTKAAELGVPKDQVEFQMLYGIRRDLQRDLLGEGYPVRIYVPFGKEWYPYFMRRLAERPANLWFFISNLIRK
jgi:proline dehydrogenase